MRGRVMTVIVWLDAFLGFDLGAHARKHHPPLPQSLALAVCGGDHGHSRGN